MSNISPNSLFHFTPKMEYLINILSHGFFPRYFREDLKLNNTREIRGHDLGIPMICFCDISLSQISNHIKAYGSYGIGMKKEWAIRNKLNPIIYVNEDSRIAEPLSIIGENGMRLNKIESQEVRKIASEIINSWLNIQMYSKPYVGTFVHRGKEYNDIKFYDEREWRYIPHKENGRLPFGSMNKEKMLEKDILTKENKKLEDYKLEFTPNDVKYIFVKEENQIHKIVTELRKINRNSFNSESVDILTSKILTTRNIKEDF